MSTSNPSAGETLKSLIRKRPVYVEILQKTFGFAFWNKLDETVLDYCIANQQKEEDLYQGLLSLDEEGISQDWVTRPLYFLIDHLTLEHEKFRTYELSLIQARMEACRSVLGIDSSYLESLINEFQDFSREFLNHMEEEEEFLFLKIIRTEASLRYPQLYPEVFKGSVSMYPSTLLHATEAEIGEMVSGVLNKVSGFPVEIVEKPELKNLVSVLKSLESKIGNHTYLEAVILFPRAKKIEDELRKRSDGGH